MRTFFASAALAALVAAQPTPTPAPDKNACTYSPGNPGVNFNACQYGVYSQDYNWADPTDINTYNSTYYFNIGLNVNIANIPSCAGLSLVSPAYQVAVVGQTPACTALSAPANPLKSTYFSQSLFDTTNPAKGWQLTYSNPAGSQACLNGDPVSFTLIMLCGDRPFPSPGPSTQQHVIETASYYAGNSYLGCEYQAMSFSQAGCPTQCPIINGHICGGNGVCGYDDNAATSRCFCYSDWIESDCQTPRYTFPSGAVAGATIGGILLGLVVVLGASYWMRGGAKGHAGAASIQGAEGFYPTQ